MTKIITTKEIQKALPTRYFSAEKATKEALISKSQSKKNNLKYDYYTQKTIDHKLKKV